MAETAWSICQEGLRLRVRLTPKSRRDSIDGVEILADGRAVVKIRIRAVPEDGRANAALSHLLAESLAVPASHIRLAAGATARIKMLKIAGEPAELLARMTALVGDRTGR